MEVLSIDFLRELIVVGIEGFFLLASTVIPMLIIYRIYIRHLSKKQAEQTCYYALLELQRRNAIETVYCEEINPNNVKGVKAKVRYEAAKRGIRADTDRFSPHRLHVKIETYRRKVEDGLPVVA